LVVAVAVETFVGSVTVFADIVVGSEDELRQSFAATISASAAFGIASGSASFGESLAFIYERGMRVGFVQSQVTGWQPAFNPDFSHHKPQLSDNAMDYINGSLVQRPTFNASTADVWNGFIGYFGSDYPTSMCLGGSMRLSYATANAYFGVVGEAFVRAQAELDFFGVLKEEGAISGDVKKADAKWMEASVRSHTCLGGGGCPTDPSDYPAWARNLAKNPHILPCGVGQASATVISLAHLFPPFLQDAFTHARANYLMRAFLQSEMLRQLHRFTSVFSQLLSQPAACAYPDAPCAFLPDQQTRCLIGRCAGCCQGDPRPAYESAVADYRRRTQARLSATSYLSGNVTGALQQPVIDPVAFAIWTAQFAELAAVLISKPETVTCSFHSDEGTCHWPHRPPCCRSGDWVMAQSNWFAGL
jgi:hypothetical protein